MNRVERILKQHSVTWRYNGERLQVLEAWTRRLPDGSLQRGQDWETLEATPAAVRRWLGY